MATETITIQLPKPVLLKAQDAARTLHFSVEDVLSRMLTAAFADADAPLEMRAELTRMAWLSDQKLWGIAHSKMSKDQQNRMRQLAEGQATRDLSQDEEERLEALRQEYARVTLRKAHAYALLSMRSGQPLLAQA